MFTSAVHMLCVALCSNDSNCLFSWRKFAHAFYARSLQLHRWNANKKQALRRSAKKMSQNIPFIKFSGPILDAEYTFFLTNFAYFESRVALNLSLESPSKACKLNSHECDSYFYLSKSIEFGSFNWICKHWCFFWIHSLQLVQWFAHPASCLIAIFHSLFFDRYNWSHSEFSSNCYSDHFAINLKHERQKDAQLITVSVSARRLTQLKIFQSIIRFNLDISGYYSRAMTNQTKWKEKTNNQFQSVVFNRFFRIRDVCTNVHKNFELLPFYCSPLIISAGLLYVWLSDHMIGTYI